MKKRIIAIIVLIFSICCMGCREFEYGYDKFYLEEVGTYGGSTPIYYFVKKIDSDIIFEPYDRFDCPQGYRLYGDSCPQGKPFDEAILLSGNWDYLSIHNKDLSDGDSPIIRARFICYSKEGMGDTKLDIYFNYTVASTGERKEEVWEVDFGQEPFEDKREK